MKIDITYRYSWTTHLMLFSNKSKRSMIYECAQRDIITLCENGSKVRYCELKLHWKLPGLCITSIAGIPNQHPLAVNRDFYHATRLSGKCGLPWSCLQVRLRRTCSRKIGIVSEAIGAQEYFNLACLETEETPASSAVHHDFSDAGLLKRRAAVVNRRL